MIESSPGGSEAPGDTFRASPSGATIDAFDETTGVLFNDTFVPVAPDPSGALTQSGNVEGCVDTTNSNEAITALSPTSPTNVIFSRWVNLGPPAVTLTSSPTLQASEGVPLLAYAFYDAPVVGTLVVNVFEDSAGGLHPALATVTAYPGG